MGHRVELVLGPVQRLALFAEALLGPACGDAGDDHQQCHHADGQRQGLLVSAAGVRGDLQQQAARHRQHQCVHAGVMHGHDGQAHDQTTGAPLPVVAAAMVVAEVEAQDQRHQHGGDGNQDRQAEGPGLVVQRGRRANGRHPGVVHRGNAGAGGGSRQAVLPAAQALAAEQAHDQVGGGHGDHQREQGNPVIVGNIQWRLKRQHRDEVHRPDAAAQG